MRYVLNTVSVMIILTLNRAVFSLNDMTATHLDRTLWQRIENHLKFQAEIAAQPSNFKYLEYLSGVRNVHIITQGADSCDQITEFKSQLARHLHNYSNLKILSWELATNCKQAEIIESLYEHEAFIILYKHHLNLLTTIPLVEECIKFWNPRAKFILINLQENFNTNEMQSTFEILWQREAILNVLMVVHEKEYSHNTKESYLDIQAQIWKYCPFHLRNNSTRRGKIALHGASKTLSNVDSKRMSNLFRYTVKFSLFIQYPNMFVRYTHNSKPMIDNILGIDSLMLYTLVKKNNFQSKLTSPTDKGTFGYKLNDGTFGGSLGDVIDRRVDIAFNSRFIKPYGTNKFEFSEPVGIDRLCIIVPKSKKIPHWRRVLLCFDDKTWFLIMIAFVICSAIRCICMDAHSGRHIPGTVLDMYRTALGLPVPPTPRQLKDRYVFGSFQLFSLTIVAAFQGLLVTNLSLTKYEPDINTLKDLALSNLTIYSRSPYNADLFGEETGNYIMDLLRAKFVLYPGSSEELLKLVTNQAAGALLSRESSYSYLAAKSVLTDGSKLLHKVAECPTFYNLAYIAPRGSPFLPMINTHIQRVINSGLTQKWQSDAVAYALRMTRNITVEQGALRVFSLTDLQLPFLILAVGGALGIVGFLSELGVKTWRYLKCGGKDLRRSGGQTNEQVLRRVGEREPFWM